jgi:long-chain acyl-CoA synthetase
MQVQNLGELFFIQAKAKGEKPMFWMKWGGRYQPISGNQMAEEVSCLMSAFHHWRFAPGDKIAILAENRYEWPLVDFAALSLGMTDVPIYPTNTADQAGYILEHSETRCVVVSTQEQLRKLLAIKNGSSLLDCIVVMDTLKRLPKGGRINILKLAEVVDLGRKHIKQLNLEKTLSSIPSSAMATIIYTSGTTANPKGVCLSHSNFLSNARDALTVLKIDESHKYLSFLPLSHVFERTAGLYATVMGGVEVAYAENMDSIAQNMVETQPTVIMGVPRFYEKLHARIQNALETAPKAKQLLIQLAMNAESTYRKYLESQQTPPLWLKAARKVLNQFILKNLHKRLGGRVRLMVSGGAPINPEVCEYFQRLGLNIFQGYGLTETSPVITVNTNPSKLASVGQVIPNVQIKFAEDGEILCKGPNLMMGYFKDPEATRETFAPGGWLKTGDIGKLDHEGYLYITDRKKDIIITSGGKNVAPAKIEGMLKNTSLVDHALIVGDQRKFLTALIVPNPMGIETLAKKERIHQKLPSLYSHPLIQKAIHECVQKVNRELASYEQIKRYRIITQPFDIESGDLTPTLKIKKRQVMQKYAHLIEEMYSDL